jgi:hypothetical protein
MRIPNYTLILKSCPGGVGAIMWACRAHDSGSNPGQGVVFRARSSVWQSAWLLTKWPRVQFPSGPFLILMQHSKIENFRCIENHRFSNAFVASLQIIAFAIFNWRIKCEKRYLKTQISSRTYYFVKI